MVILFMHMQIVSCASLQVWLLGQHLLLARRLFQLLEIGIRVKECVMTAQELTGDIYCSLSFVSQKQKNPDGREAGWAVTE